MMEPDDCTVDLVLTNGRVIDPETGVDGLRHVGIRGGEIVSIQRATEVPRPAAQQIDASRSVIAPGFIDLHSHSQTINGLRFQAMDGVTTALDLESGRYRLRRPTLRWLGRVVRSTTATPRIGWPLG